MHGWYLELSGIRCSYDVDYNSFVFLRPNISWPENVSLSPTATEILIFDNSGQTTLKMKVVRLFYNARNRFFDFLDKKSLLYTLQYKYTSSEYRLQHRGQAIKDKIHLHGTAAAAAVA